MHALGYLRLERELNPSDDASLEFSINQIWPTPADVKIHAGEIANVRGSIPKEKRTSVAGLTDFLASTAVTYDTDGTHATHITTHPNTVIPSVDFEWCPIFSATTPFELESLVNDTHPLWIGPQPTEKSSDIHGILNEKLVLGLGLRKQGKTFQIIVKRPTTLESIPKQDKIIIQDAKGWLISKPKTAPTAQPTRATPPPIAFSPQPAANNVTDHGVFDSFEKLVASRGLVYDRNDLILLYCSLRSSQFVILSGTGGIGKSSLALMVAEFLQCTIENQRLAWLPVEPSWVSSEQLVGRYDSVARVFRPANGNLADVLVHANRDPQAHLVCLDELNLARVEHYLAPLLSLKEHRDNALGWSLYSGREADECLNRQHYPPSVAMASNVFWMGTVNMDEASFGLTDKFLDRAAYIGLRQSPFTQKPDAQSKMPETPTFPLTAPTPITLTTEELKYFDQLNHLCRRPLLGWRTLDAMKLSIGAIPAHNGRPVWDQKTAWDEHFVTRIFSKFRGTGMEWESWQSALPQLRQHLKASPWGSLERSLSVLKEIEETKEPQFVI